MFGLLHYSTPGLSESELDFSRLHYCGTCKVMGSQFGHSSRLTLNSDIVYLSELLSAINHEDEMEWGKAFHSYNCFKMPGKNTTVPASLNYAAALNMVLAGLKIKDNADDSKNILWKIVRHFYNPAFKKSLNILNQKNVPVEKLLQLARENNRRENSGKRGAPVEIFSYYSRPVALLTAIAIKYGAEDEATGNKLFRLGYQFGKLIYLLDAFKDREEDKKKKQFNPFFQLTVDCPNADFEKEMLKILKQGEHGIKELGISESKTQYFISKLHTNFSLELSRLSLGEKIVHTCSHTVEKITMSLRYSKAAKSVRQIKEVLQQKLNPGFWQQLKLRFVLPVIVFLTVFIRPASAAMVTQQHSMKGLDSVGDWSWLFLMGAAGIFYKKRGSFSPCCDKCRNGDQNRKCC